MKKGFTLIELLIVITIIGILAVAFLPQLLGAPSRARDTVRVDALKTYADSLTNYMLQIGGVHATVVEQNDQGEDQIRPLFPEDCLRSDLIPPEFIAVFGGIPPNDPDPENVLPLDPAGKFDILGMSGCQGGFGVIPEPSEDYDFGLYAHVENLENANTLCSTAYEGELVKPVETDDPVDYCFAILIAA